MHERKLDLPEMIKQSFSFSTQTNVKTIRKENINNLTLKIRWKYLPGWLNIVQIYQIYQIYLMVGLDNGDVAPYINPVICFLTKAKWPKIWNRVNKVF